jgi:hypothetical protein
MILRLDELTTFLTGEVHARRNYKYSLRRALGKDYARPLAASGLRPWSRIHYFNSGVVIVPCQHCHTLETHWHTWAEQLLTSYRGRPLSEQVGFAMALASGKLPYAFLPMHYNETNWKPPSPEASIIHYNAYDPINREVKKKFLLSFNDFRDFLLQTDNRFWRAHAPAILCLPELELARLAERITTTLQLSQI